MSHSRTAPTWIMSGLSVSALMLAACGGSQPPAAPVVSPQPAPTPSAAVMAAPTAPPAATSAPDAPTASAPAPAAPLAYKDMNTEQRKQYMKTTVLPKKMKGAFVSFNAHDYGVMNCATCHGAGVKEGNFKMPNPSLPRLPPDEAGFKALTKKQPDAMKFMGSKVVPMMADLVGEAPYNPQTHEGFGCFECHTKK